MHMLVWHVLWPLNLSLRVLESSSRGLDGKVLLRKMIIAIYTRQMQSIARAKRT